MTKFTLNLVTILCIVSVSSLFAQTELKNPAVKYYKEASTHQLPVHHILAPNLDALNEGFESGVVPPTGWTADVTNASYTWEVDNFAPYEGTYNATVLYDALLVPQDEWLKSPSVDLSTFSQAYLTFYWNTSYYWLVDPFDNGETYLKISTDGGSTWTSLWSESDAGVFTNWEWNETILDISAYAGLSNVMIAFNYVAVDAAQFSVDAVSISDAACIVVDATNPAPADLSTSNDLTGVSLEWTNDAGTAGTELYFGTDPGSLSLVAGDPTTLLTNYALGTLDQNTNYYWQVVSYSSDPLCYSEGLTWSFRTGFDASVNILGYWGFEDGLIPTEFNVIDANSDTYTWAPYNFVASSGSWSWSIQWNSSLAMDDWFSIGPFDLSTSNAYNLYYDFRVASALYPENLTVYLATANDGTGIVSTLADYADYVNENYVTYNNDFTVPSDGSYYLVFWGHSALDEFRMYLDEIYLTSTAGSSVITIAEAIEDLDMNFIPDHYQDTLTVRGVVISPNYQTSNRSYYIWDGTAGVVTFMPGLTSVAPDLGDEVEVLGWINQYNGLTEIQPLTDSDIQVISTGNAVPDPVVLTLAEYKANSEMYEGTLIGFVGLNKVSGTWPASGASVNLSLSDGVDTVVFRVDSDTDIDGQPEPTWPQDVIGIGSQFDSSVPPDGGYQILPRYYATDFLPVGTVPVELTSFNAKATNNVVYLNWSTATETNNRGFEIERKTTDQFITVGYVDGHGTSTEIHNYSFADSKVESGTYYYRLKQVDFDGSYAYSPVVEIEVLNPVSFALDQNYPNPFNPSTIINVSLAADSKIKLVVYDILGQQVSTLVNGNLAAGSHQFEFNASNLNSGVYFYRVDAAGVDGTNFSSVKKMILTK